MVTILMIRPLRLALLSACIGGLAACASTTETFPSRTATEQLLVARAAERAVEGLVLPVEPGVRVFVDDSYFRAETSPYAISAIRESLSEAGYRLARDRNNADVIFEVRSGALSLEQMRRLVGLPAMTVPVESLSFVSIPELSVYSRRDRVGVAEFSGFVYDAQTGSPLGAVAPMIGEYRIRSHRLLMMVSFGQQSATPGERDPGSSWREF